MYSGLGELIVLLDLFGCVYVRGILVGLLDLFGCFECDLLFAFGLYLVWVDCSFLCLGW